MLACRLYARLSLLFRRSLLRANSSSPFTVCSSSARSFTASSGSMNTGTEQSEVGTVATEWKQTDPSSHVEIQEGRAKILFPSSNEVFYNPVQEFNRDLSIAVIKYYSEHLWTPKAGKKKSAKHKTVEQEQVAAKVTKTMPKSSNSQTESIKQDSLDDNNLTKQPLKQSSDDVQNVTVTTASSSSGGCEESVNKEDTMETGSSELVSAVEGDTERNSHDDEGGSERERMELQDQEGEKDTDNEVVGVPRDAVGDSSGATDRSTSSVEPGLKILEALAASGLRSIRYALEIPRVGTVVANDLSKDAYQSMCRNIEHNLVGDKVKPTWREASMLMYEHREPFSNRFDVIDLDPYGSPSLFLDSTVQSVKDGGLLCVTCTDMSVLCGTHSESCHSKYGAMSIKAKFCHEMALRIVLASLESHANRYRRYIVPLMSCSIDFYVRLFVRVFTSPAEVKRSPSKLAMVYNCIGCESYHLQPVGKRIEEGRSRKYPPGTGPPVDRKCDQCGSVFRLGGPIWAEAIHDGEFVKGLLSATRKSPKGTYRTIQRITGLLTVVSEELPDAPLYYVLDSISSTMHCSQPKMLAIRSAIMNAGYRVSISHANANAIKTDAPHHVIWDIMRCWSQTSTVKQPGPNTPAAAILSKPTKIKASFAIRKDANPPSRLLKLTRFPENPEANWGPKARAKRSGESGEDLAAKRRKLQGKRTNSHDNHDQP